MTVHFISARLAPRDALAELGELRSLVEYAILNQEHLRKAQDNAAHVVSDLSATVRDLASKRRQRKGPEGLISIQNAVADTGWSYSKIRRLCKDESYRVGAKSVGGCWYLDAAKLSRRLAE